MGVRSVIACLVLSLLLLQPLFSIASLSSQSSSQSAGRAAVVRIEISPSPPLSIDADSQLQFTATMYDSNDDQVLGSPDWWASSGAIDAGGLFTPETVGVVLLSATEDGVNETFNITVIAGWPDSMSISSNTTEVMLGESLLVNATLFDAKGNPVSDRTLSWIAACGNISESGEWTPMQPGTCTISAHWDELVASINLTAVPGLPERILLPADIRVRSGESVLVEPTLVDGWGNVLPISYVGSLTWSIASGEVISGFEYLADEPGYWWLNVSSSGGPNGSTIIEVVPAAIVGLQLLAPQGNVMADEEVELQVLRTDIFGHVTNEIVPLSNWSIEDGSLKMVDNGTIWVPNQVGVWNITVFLEGYSDNLVIEVVHGWAETLILAADDDRISADEQTVIWMQASDSRNNRWIVNGSWNPLQEAARGWLEEHGSWARFEAVEVGNWSIVGEWFDAERQVLLSASIMLQVTAGKVALINLNGEGESITSDDFLDLAPTFEDADGNVIAYALLNWTVIKEGVSQDKTVEMRLTKGVFHPDGPGSYEIRARSGTAFSSVRFHVNHGQARNLTLDVFDSIQVVSGSSGAITISISATDLSGHWFEVENLSWEMDPRAGVLSPHVAGLGKWVFEGFKVGNWQLLLTSGQASRTLTIEVLAGPVHRLEANLSAVSVEQGAELFLTVRAFDEHDNSILLDDSQFSVHSTTGDVSALGGGVWRLDTDEGGDNHAVTIRYENLTQQRFFDVNEAILGGVFGSSNGALVVGSGLIILVLITLMVIRLRNRPDDGPKSYNLGTESEASSSQKLSETGVLVAARGTVQGQSGWYNDAEGELSQWHVDTAGGWTKVQ